MAHYRVGDTPVSDSEAREVACPECKAAPGASCVYVWPKGVNPDSPWHTPGVQARIARVGTPTRKAHNARRLAASAARKARPAPAAVRVTLVESELRDLLAATTIHGATRDKLELALWRLAGDVK